VRRCEYKKTYTTEKRKGRKAKIKKGWKRFEYKNKQFVKREGVGRT
jgi:hypothetical protein